MTVTQTDLSVRRLAGNIGAEITGVALSGDLPDETVQQIRDAVLAHKVVFFRGQHLDDATQVAFAGRLGHLTLAHPTVPATPGDDAILDLDNGGDPRRAASTWHTDVTFIVQPPSFSVLRSTRIPSVGGDTLWANTAHAYETLPDDLRSLADRLWAVHTNEYDYASLAVDKEGAVNPQVAEYASVFASTVYKSVHPVVRVHPETGERALLLGGFARSLVGFDTHQSESLLRTFHDHVTRPENVVRWQWQVGDVIVWDNRSTQHYGVGDFHEPRDVRRVTVVGEVPVSIDGRPSTAVQGDASAYNRQAAASAN